MKPSERINEILTEMHKYSSFVPRTQATIQYLDEEWNKKQLISQNRFNVGEIEPLSELKDKK